MGCGYGSVGNCAAYLHLPNRAERLVRTAGVTQTLHEETGAVRLDANTRWALCYDY